MVGTIPGVPATHGPVWRRESNMIRTLIATAALASIPCAGRAGAAFIDFDDGTAGQPVFSTYSGLGVFFFDATFTSSLGLPGSSGSLAIRDSTDRFQPTPISPIIARFNAPQAFVGVVGVDVGENGIRLDAFDAEYGGRRIASDTAFGIELGVGQSFALRVQAAGIRRVEMYQPILIGPDGLVLDDFQFGTVSVPEPPGAVLVAIGVLGLMAGRRVRRGSR